MRIPNRFIETWDEVALFHSKGDVEKANAILFPNEKSAFALNNGLNDLTAKEWLPETVTVFSQKGLGAGNKNAQAIRNSTLRVATAHRKTVSHKQKEDESNVI